MPASRNLKADFKVKLTSQYRNTEDPISGVVFDDLEYLEVHEIFKDGAEAGQANIQHYSDRSLTDSSEIINLSSDLQNSWGDTLDFVSVRLGVILNKSATGILRVNYRDEQHRIGPGGFRIFFDPSLDGVSSDLTTSNELTATAEGSVAYDLILYGSGINVLANQTLWLNAGNNAFTSGSRQYISSSSQHHSINDSTDFDMSSTNMTMCAWVYLDDTSTIRRVMGQWGTSSQLAYSILFSADNKLGLYLSHDGSTQAILKSGDNIVSGQWYFIIADYDATNSLMSIQLNDGPVSATANSAGIFNSTSDFMIGGSDIGTFYMNGRVSRAGLWKRLLTKGEKSFLYHSGLGKAYIDLGKNDNGVDILTSMVSYWDLNEIAGQARDSHGSNNLSDNSSTGNAAKIEARGRDMVGVTDYFSIADNDDIDMGTDDFSLSFWGNRDPGGALAAISKGTVGVGAAYQAQVLTTGSLELIISDGGSSGAVSTTGTVGADEWHHIVLVTDRSLGQADWYVDGVFFEQVAFTNPGPIDNSSDLEIGRSRG